MSTLTEDLLPGVGKLMKIADDWQALTEETRERVLDALNPDHVELLMILIRGYREAEALFGSRGWMIPEGLSNPLDGGRSLAASRADLIYAANCGIELVGIAEIAQEGWTAPCLPD